ncbi:cobalamin biosynthesis protein [Streptomyces oceani]|uniref:Cobalamin biosynthesis protein CobD n=1 Tax=Streptomyces oceani TaxID=1075402 RepID=A0A1E7JYW2_9ACTN|nr:cobalamin biosynthesis protein [Streptomyces oceani]OEU96864.1 cobalamin biosynthesis protein CobD [Streptomyces oceani]
MPGQSTSRGGSWAYGTALGYLTDLLLGDPRRGHPVAAFGRGAATLERLLWRDRRAAGAVHTALCVGGATTAVVALGHAVARASPAAQRLNRTVLTGTASWAVLGGSSLAREATGVGAALEAGDLEEARALLPRLCGRDPRALDGEEIARATVESLAENTSDAVVGALVWGALAGTPGLVAFRAVNTLDAMVGHRSDRYARFGWSAARLDDAMGWPGARLTALLATVAGPDREGALRSWRADGRAHPSPNAGPVEAAFAGALGLRLGGTLSYGGRVEHRPPLNAHGRTPQAGDIARAARLSRRVGALALLGTVAGGLVGRLAGRAVRATLAGGGSGVRRRAGHATPSARLAY